MLRGCTRITVDGIRYYSKDDFLVDYPVARTERDGAFASFHQISDHKPVLASQVGDEWVHQPDRKIASKDCRPFFTSEALMKVCERLQTGKKKPAYGSKTSAVKKPKPPIPKRAFRKVPASIELDEADKYINAEGKRVTIRMFGERIMSQCYFMVADVEEAMKIQRTQDIVTAKDSSHHYGRNYIFMMFEGEKTLFLTYIGLNRLLTSSHNPNRDSYEDWICGTLFTAHHGTIAAKKKLAAKLMGIDYAMIKKIFGHGTQYTPFSCVYIAEIGEDETADHLWVELPHSTDPKKPRGKIRKIGCTRDIVERMRRHEIKYGGMPGNSFKLEYTTHIDESNRYQAEAEIINWLSQHNFKLEVEGYKELFYSDDKILNQVKTFVNHIGCLYQGKIDVVRNKMHKMENDHNKQMHKSELEHTERINAIIERTDKELVATKKRYKEKLMAVRNELGAQKKRHKKKCQDIEEAFEEKIDAKKLKIQSQKDKIQSQKDKIGDLKVKLREATERIDELETQDDKAVRKRSKRGR